MYDSELVTILTLSLPQFYEPLVMALQSRSDIITFDKITGRLLQESGRRQISQALNPAERGRNNSSTALWPFGIQQAPKSLIGMGDIAIMVEGGDDFEQGSEIKLLPQLPMKLERIPAHSVNKFLMELSVSTCGKAGTGKKNVINEKLKKALEQEQE